ncbi:MAG: GNAT family N-acetyltransferase [Sedimentitalea sp.]
MKPTLRFVDLDASHLPGAVQLSTAVGWPHQVADWAFSANLSKGVVALDGDRVVGTAMATPFGPVAMANMIIVAAEWQGRGLGRDVMQRAMDRVPAPAWQLVATPQGVPLYTRLGFVQIAQIVQHSGLVDQVTPQGSAEWAKSADHDAIVALDRAASGKDRAALYRALTSARFAVLRHQGEIVGFAAVRRFGQGEVIGPVVGENLETAKSLIALIMSERQGRFLRLDTDVRSGLAPWLSACGLAQVGDGLQMQKGQTELRQTRHHVYALASQALG